MLKRVQTVYYDGTREDLCLLPWQTCRLPLCINKYKLFSVCVYGKSTGAFKHAHYRRTIEDISAEAGRLTGLCEILLCKVRVSGN